MLELSLSVYLAYRNSLRAKIKGQDPILCAFATIAAILFCMVAGGIFVTLVFCNGAISISGLTSFDSKQRAAASQQLQHALTGNPLHLVTIELCAIGGYLLIRRLLEKEPDVKQQTPTTAKV